MGKGLELKIAGLWTSPNDYTTPPGALDVADNCVVDQNNLGGSRRGFEIEIDNSNGDQDGFPMLTMIATNPNSSTYEILDYRYNRVAEEGRLLLADVDSITGDTDFLPPEGAQRVRMVNWAKYIYITSNQGIKRYSAALNSSRPAGIPQALDLVLSLTGSSGYLTSNDVATVPVTTTNASPTLSYISNEDVQNFFIGQIVTGSGINAGTTITDVILSVPVVIYATNLTAGNTVVVVPANTGIAVGQIVSGVGIQEGTRVAPGGISGLNITLTLAPITTATGTTVTFSSDNTATMSANATASATAVSVTLSSGSQVAYRLVWGLINENKAVMLGAPSAFTAITNNVGGSRDVQAIATIPEQITTDNFYQLYRSVATPTQSIVPADQMQLVVQGVPTSGDISAGFITITDSTPDSLKGEALYTGTDVEGIASANYRPPFAVDMAEFRGYVIYANYTLPYQLELNIDGVGSPDGVQSGDVITISDNTTTFDLTADSSENTATGHFEVFTTGTPAQNIADTAASFIRVLNRSASNSICYAYLLSGQSDLPGQILLQARASIGVFDVIASAHGDAWTPNIDTLTEAEADSAKNALLISKPQETEAVPLINKFLAGGVGVEILRVVSLRDYVFILTTAGAYRLTGNSIDTFNIEPFDPTVRLVAPEPAVALGNECWCLSTQGAVSLSDGGARIRSGLQINKELQALIQKAPTALREIAFAVGYESNQKYILSLPEGNGDTTTTQQLTYNYITDRWTRWTRNATAGYVHPLDGLYLNNGNNQNVVLERTNGDFTDYVDESFEVVIESFDDIEVTLSSVSGIVVGDLIWQDHLGVEVYAEVISIDTPSNTVTVSQVVEWELGLDPELTRCFTAISCAIQWKPMSQGDPTEAKQHSEGQLIFRSDRFYQASIQIATDVSPGFVGTTLFGQNTGRWGQFGWGQVAWGGVTRPVTKRFYIPADQQYAGIIIPRLEIRSGYSNWELEGGSITVYDISGELGGPNG